MTTFKYETTLKEEAGMLKLNSCQNKKKKKPPRPLRSPMVYDPSVIRLVSIQGKSGCEPFQSKI